MHKGSILTKGDIAVMALVLFAALLGLIMLAGSRKAVVAGLNAEIYVDGQLRQTVTLAEVEQEMRLETTLGYNVLKINAQGIRMVEADCHSQDCVQAGLKTLPGEMIACLPHRVLVLLRGSQAGGVDAIVY